MENEILRMQFELIELKISENPVMEITMNDAALKRPMQIRGQVEKGVQEVKDSLLPQ